MPFVATEICVDLLTDRRNLLWRPQKLPTPNLPISRPKIAKLSTIKSIATLPTGVCLDTSTNSGTRSSDTTTPLNSTVSRCSTQSPRRKEATFWLTKRQMSQNWPFLEKFTPWKRKIQRMMRKNSLVARLTRGKMNELKWRLGSGLRLKSPTRSKTSNSTFLQLTKSSRVNLDQACQLRKRIHLILAFTRQEARGLSLGQILERKEKFAPKPNKNGS